MIEKESLATLRESPHHLNIGCNLGGIRMPVSPGDWHFVSYFALKPEAQAAWAQAFLSAGAIYVSSVIWRADNARKRREEEYRKYIADYRTSVRCRAELRKLGSEIRELLRRALANSILKDTDFHILDLEDRRIEYLINYLGELTDISAKLERYVLDTAAAAREYAILATQVQIFHTMNDGRTVRVVDPTSIEDCRIQIQRLDHLLQKLVRHFDEIANRGLEESYKQDVA